VGEVNFRRIYDIWNHVGCIGVARTCMALAFAYGGGHLLALVALAKFVVARSELHVTP
jgi:hypothetical protein